MDISQTAHRGGVAVYTAKLAEKLLKIPDLEMSFFYSSLRQGYKGNLANVKQFILPPALLEPMFNRLRFPNIELFLGRLDVFHSSDWTQPKTQAKKVTTYHDLSPLLYPQWSHPQIVEVNKRRLEIVEKEVDHIIAVSQCTRKDLILVSNIPENKITVVYEGVDESFKPQSGKDMENFRREYNLPNEFVLAIGGVGERKNLLRVKQAAKDFNLVITQETIRDIPYHLMPLLYSSATVLLYPSLYEGFGLPVLEAMSVGTPVITSNVSSLPEVGGEAVLYVDPQKVTEITDNLKEVMRDGKLRKDLARRSLIQAKKFSWKKCAEQTADVYRRVVGK